MGKITEQMVYAAYDLAKAIYEKKISVSEGIVELQTKYGMNKNSAMDYVYNYQYLIEGRRFTRTTNAFATRYYLQKILEDSGKEKLLSALSALYQHIEYYNNIAECNVVTRRKIYDEFKSRASIYDENIYPDEVVDAESHTLLEGKLKTVLVNIYERNPIARTQCIEHYGCLCYICGFNFSAVYGEIGKNFIHVHHERELSRIEKEYAVDPINDLKPVCPNCHAMLHRKTPAYSISDIKSYLKSKNTNKPNIDC